MSHIRMPKMQIPNIQNPDIQISKIMWSLAGLLFPRRCPVCGDIVMPKGALICPPCVKKLSFVKNPTCKKCGKELISDTIEYCFDCSKHKRSFAYGMACINYDDTAKKSMAKIKYKNKREYLDFYGQAISARFEKQIGRMRADCLVPVPVHPARMRKRGYNQAEVLARRISEQTGIPVCTELLSRNKNTAPQKQLGPAERLKNLEEAFTAGNIPVHRSRIILIDDIYTTGSTMEACARALKRAGAKEVFFLVICIGRGL